MQQGQFYFISDDYFSKHDPEHKLMGKKETVNKVSHSRPCFFAFNDPKINNILWCIPISSKVEKYHGIVSHKIKLQLERDVKNPKCTTIRFGEVLGQERAFLIQNMFPITNNYISSSYIDKNTNTAVTIDPKTTQDIINNSKKVLKLVFKGYKNLVFSDVLKTHTDLCKELDTQKKKLQNP